MRRSRPYLALGLATVLAVSAVLTTGALSTSGDALAQSGSTSLARFLGQLKRNAKVSERLNAGFFRAPQTRGFVGSSFRPVDSETAYTANRPDSSLSLKRTRFGSEVEDGELEELRQERGTFELPLDVPNRSEVVNVQASYRSSGGGGLTFSVLKIGLQGEGTEEQLDTTSSTGIASQGGTNTTSLPIRNRGFRVDNSRFRYVLRVRIEEPGDETRLFGMTIQQVIGRGVAGAPGTTPTPAPAPAETPPPAGTTTQPAPGAAPPN